MAEHVPGDWFLVIDFRQPLSGVEVDEQAGIIKIPWATQGSVGTAMSRMKLYVYPPAQLVQGQVISEPVTLAAPQDDPDRAEIIEAKQRAADFGIP